MRLIWIMDNDYRDMGFGSETFGAYSYIAPPGLSHYSHVLDRVPRYQDGKQCCWFPNQNYLIPNTRVPIYYSSVCYPPMIQCFLGAQETSRYQPKEIAALNGWFKWHTYTALWVPDKLKKTMVPGHGGRNHAGVYSGNLPALAWALAFNWVLGFLLLGQPFDGVQTET